MKQLIQELVFSCVMNAINLFSSKLYFLSKYDISTMQISIPYKSYIYGSIRFHFATSSPAS